MVQTGPTTPSLILDLTFAAIALGLLVVLTALLIQMRRTGRQLQEAASRLEEHAKPALDRAAVVAENLEYIAAVVRTDIEGLSRSVGKITDGLDQGASIVQERIEEFNALMEVVQGEAEEIFLRTASTVRGVQAGAARLTDSAPDVPTEAPDITEEVRAELPIEEQDDTLERD